MTTESLLTDGAQTTPAAESSPATTPTPSAPATLEAGAAANQQTPTDTAQGNTEAKTDETTAPPERVAPEKYEFTAPEGTQMDEGALSDFAALAKDLKLSQVEAQTVIDKMAPAMQARQSEAIQKASDAWMASATSDKEYGGDKLTDSLSSAKKALDAFGTPELQSLLNDSRLGNHPEVIRFMVRAGKAISEDRMVTGGAGPAAGSTNTAKSLYPNQS
jgi:hypothetical protein